LDTVVLCIVHYRHSEAKFFDRYCFKIVQLTELLNIKYYWGVGTPLFRNKIKVELNWERRAMDNVKNQLEQAHFWSISPSLLCIIDEKGNFIQANPAWKNILGYAEDELIGKSILNFIHPDDIELTSAEARKIFSGVKTANYENRYCAKDGSYRWTSWNGVLSNHGQIYGVGIDITERKRAEEVLKESEEHFRTLSETTPIGIGVSSADGVILYSNPSYELILGYNPGELTGKKASELYWDPQDRSSWLGKLQKTGIARDIETRLKRKDGAPVWVSINVSSMPYHGQPAVIGTIQDITERKQAEEALKESKAKLEVALASMTDAVFITDINGDFIDFNEAFAHYHRFKSKAECFRKLAEYSDIFNGYFADGTLAPLDMWPVRRALRGETATNFELLVERKDTGEKWWGSYSFSPIRDINGKIVGAVVVARDITERKKAEAAMKESEDRFRTLANNISQLAWMADEKGWIFWYNQRWYDYTGTTLQEMEGWGWQKVHHPEHVEKVTEKFKHSVETGEVWEDTFPLRAKDGNYRWFLSRAVPIQDTQGNVIRWFGTNTDINEQLKTEEELRRYSAELEAFNYSVSHDLRQPLRALESFSDLLTSEYRDKLDENGREYVNRINKASQYMYQLTDDMLKLSRINRADMYRDNINLTEIAQSILNELKSSQPERKIEIKITAGIMVTGDKNLLTIATRNLLENACKFTSKCPEARIEIGKIEKDGEKVYFIRDNGIGLDMRYKDKLFQPFQRLTTDRSYSGTGIGLAIVQRVIHRHGGRIWAESELDKGATFYFTLG
jgi:PAS domain S-box-containing protein